VRLWYQKRVLTFGIPLSPVHNLIFYILPSLAEFSPMNTLPCKFCYVELISNKVIVHILHQFFGGNMAGASSFRVGFMTPVFNEVRKDD